MISRFVMPVVVAVLLVGFALPARAAETPGGPATVQVASLNLRAGPGFDYLVLRVLSSGQSLRLLGRSVDGVWAEVRLPDSTGGWVFAGFLNTAVALDRLPVTEASGGPDQSVSTRRRYNVLVTIVDDQAGVELRGFPADTKVSLRLGPAGTAESQVVGGTVTDANGAGRLVFAMPAAWANGRPVAEGDLMLVAVTADGTLRREARLQYYR